MNNPDASSVISKGTAPQGAGKETHIYPAQLRLGGNSQSR